MTERNEIVFVRVAREDVQRAVVAVDTVDLVVVACLLPVLVAIAVPVGRACGWWQLHVGVTALLSGSNSGPSGPNNHYSNTWRGAKYLNLLAGVAALIRHQERRFARGLQRAGVPGDLAMSIVKHIGEKNTQAAIEGRFPSQKVTRAMRHESIVDDVMTELNGTMS